MRHASLDERDFKQADTTKIDKKSQAKALKKALQEIKKQTRLQQQALDKKYDEQLVNENVDKQSLQIFRKR